MLIFVSLAHLYKKYRLYYSPLFSNTLAIFKVLIYYKTGLILQVTIISRKQKGRLLTWSGKSFYSVLKCKKHIKQVNEFGSGARGAGGASVSVMAVNIPAFVTEILNSGVSFGQPLLRANENSLKEGVPPV